MKIINTMGYTTTYTITFLTPIDIASLPTT